MEHGAFSGGLEVRRGKTGTRLRGRFPYNSRAVLSDGGRRGRPRKESFASRAFSYRIEREEEDIHLLVGHDYDKPLASRGTNTLDIRDDDEAVTFEARITPELEDVTHVRDALALLSSGLAVGISPGFRLPPERAVPEPERVEEEDPSEGSAIIRTVVAALLYELSIVTRPAYPETSVEARAQAEADAQRRARAMARWRA